MYKTGGQLLGINGSIFKFNTSNATIVKMLNPQPTGAVDDMCIDGTNNTLFVSARGTGEVWVYSTITLTRIATIPGFSGILFLRIDPNTANNRITVYDFYNGQFKLIDRTTLALNNIRVTANSYFISSFEYDQNIGRNQIIVPGGNTLTILNATTFEVIQQITDPLFSNLGKARSNAYNPNEVLIFTNGGTQLIVVNMGNTTYLFKTLSNAATDGTADPNLPNNKMYTVFSGISAVYTASDFGFIQTLSFPASYNLVADPTTANHRLFGAGNGVLYAATLG